MVESAEGDEEQVEAQIEEKGDARKGARLELEQLARRVVRDEALVLGLGDQIERMVLDPVDDVMVEQAKVVLAGARIVALVEQCLHLVGHLLDESPDLRVATVRRRRFALAFGTFRLFFLELFNY